MKVDNERLAGLASPAANPSAESDRVERLKRFRPETAGHTGGHDQVNLSGLATGIVAASQASAAEHVAHVQAVTKAYQSGRYQAEPSALSRKLIAAWLAHGPAAKE